MNLTKIKLSQLRALVAIADLGNFSEAALLPPGYTPQGAYLSLDELRSLPLIGSSQSSCGLRIHTELSTQDEPLKLAYRIRHDSSMVAMVQQGLGIAILPRLAAEPVPTNVRIYPLPFALSRPIGATVLKAALHSPALYVFLDALRGTGAFSPAQAG